VLAGRHFPGNEEALLAGFPAANLSGKSSLPSGRGFSVALADLGSEEGNGKWISLSRQGGGSLDLFAAMAEDILGVLAGLKGGGDQSMFRGFISRVAAWQDFMEKERPDVLGKEGEVGLFGELVVLQNLLAEGLPPVKVLESWQGPLEGLHDFVMGQGAIEVKSTIAPVGFNATIGSLEQLDEALVAPLFLACVRIPLHEGGRTLADLVDEIRSGLSADPRADSLFESRLLHAGYLSSCAALYQRKFQVCMPRLLPVDGNLPRVTRRNVPPGVRKAKYEIELDGLGLPETSLVAAIERLGVTPSWN
jgi:hypothetical protein